jgi:hypothetical protein
MLRVGGWSLATDSKSGQKKSIRFLRLFFFFFSRCQASLEEKSQDFKTAQEVLARTVSICIPCPSFASVVLRVLLLLNCWLLSGHTNFYVEKKSAPSK